MLTVIFTLALAGVAGGYLVARAALFDVWRDRAERRRDVAGAALDGTLDALDPPFGVIVGDTTLVDLAVVDPDRRTRFRWWRTWAAGYAANCNVCAGWWAVGFTLALWATVAGLTGGTGPVAAAEVAPALGAAVGLHTIITSAGNKGGVW